MSKDTNSLRNLAESAKKKSWMSLIALLLTFVFSISMFLYADSLFKSGVTPEEMGLEFESIRIKDLEKAESELSDRVDVINKESFAYERDMSTIKGDVLKLAIKVSAISYRGGDNKLIESIKSDFY